MIIRASAVGGGSDAVMNFIERLGGFQRGDNADCQEDRDRCDE